MKYTRQHSRVKNVFVIFSQSKSWSGKIIRYVLAVGAKNMCYRVARCCLMGSGKFFALFWWVANICFLLARCCMLLAVHWPRANIARFWQEATIRYVLARCKYSLCSVQIILFAKFHGLVQILAIFFARLFTIHHFLARCKYSQCSIQVQIFAVLARCKYSLLWPKYSLCYG